MSEQLPPPPPPESAPYAAAPVPPPPNWAVQQPQGPGPIGQVRSTGMCILLAVVTLGIYTWFWWYKVHEEMKQHTGRGLGGLVALLLAIFIGVVTPFFTSDEVGKLYERTGRPTPVSAHTGLWYFPGNFLVVLPIVWFVKTNGALNDYWRSQGAA
jgi:hypothetical protein